MISRMRALPSGTVGNAIPVAITPSSNSAREKSIAARPSPTIIGVIGVSLAGVFTPPMLNPDALQFALEIPRVLPQLARCAPAPVSSMSNAAMHVAATDGGCEVENRNGRARW